MTVAADPRIGTELASYRIEALLGRGGMGVVYVAEQLRLKRRVALKLLAPELAADERFRERFLRESELAASIDHSNIIPIYDAGEAEGLLYIAMRYVKGIDLGTLLVSKGRLEPDRAVAIIGAVASALDAAHARGLVHRDVKPANVLLAEDGTIYLADFGLTRSADERGSADRPHLSGTPEYIAPEQIEGGDLAASADIYSLGCVLYHCLGGKSPFGGSSPVGLLFAHLEKAPPSLTEQRSELPGGIDHVIAKALAKEPAERYRSCQELCEAAGEALGLRWLAKAREWDHQHRERSLLLRGSELSAAELYLDSIGAGADPALTALQRHYVSASRASVSRRQRSLMAASLAVAAVAAVSLVFALISRSHATSEAKRADASAEQAREAAAQAKAAETTQLAQYLGAQALLEDDLTRSLLLARQAVVVEDTPKTRSDLLTALLRSPAAVGVTSGEGEGLQQIAISPDGRILAVSTGRITNLYLFDARTLKRIPVSISLDYLPRGLSFSPDGQTLAMASRDVEGTLNGVLQLFDAVTLVQRARRDFPTAEDVADEDAVGRVAYSPDGKLLATAGQASSGWKIVLRDPATGERVGAPIETNTGARLDFVFTPAGRSILTTYERQGAALVQWDVETRQETRTFAGEGGTTIAASPDGRIVGIGRQDGTIGLLDIGSGHMRAVSGHHATAVTSLRFSPDGKTLVTTSGDETAIAWEVASGAQREMLRGHSASVQGAAFSRDGDTLYTVGDTSAIAWDMTGDRGLGRQVAFSSPTIPNEWYASRFSPDGKLIAVGLADRGIGLWSATDLTPVGARLTEIGWVRNIDFSSDGKLLAAIGWFGDVAIWDVRSHSLLSGPFTVSPGGGPPDVSFSPDGTTIAAAGDNGLTLWDVATGASLGQLGDAGSATGISFDPTRQLLAFGRTVYDEQHRGAVEVWDVHTRTRVATVRADKTGVLAVAFSPDGKLLVTGGFDSIVRLWDPRTGEQIRELDAGATSGHVIDIAFNPDGTTLAVAGDVGNVSLWDVASGVRIGSKLESSVPGTADSSLWTSTDFSPDGKRLVMSIRDGRGVVWDVDPESWKRRACEIANRTLTQEEWDEFLPGRPYEPACTGASG